MTKSDDSRSEAPRRLHITAASKPALARHVRLRHDETRQQWLLLAPERLLSPSETAIDVLRMCDGARTVADVAALLAAEYDAPASEILADILPLLQELADQRYLAA